MTAKKTYEISKEYFGEGHIVTEFSRNMEKFFPNLGYPFYGWLPEKENRIELVRGFDKSSTKYYIA